MNCRHCHTPLSDVFIDLGAAPPSNAFLRAQDLVRPELHFPLKVYTCQECLLVQVDEVQRHDALFSDDVQLLYQHIAAYAPLCEAGVRFDDPDLAIDWPLPVALVSVRDAGQPCLRETLEGLRA